MVYTPRKHRIHRVFFLLPSSLPSEIHFCDKRSGLDRRSLWRV